MLLLFIGRRYLYYIYDVWNVDVRRPLSTPAINISATFILPGHWKHCTKSIVWEKKWCEENETNKTKNQRTNYKWWRYGVDIWKKCDFREEEPFRKPFNRVSTWIELRMIHIFFPFLFRTFGYVSRYSMINYTFGTISQIYFHYMML